MTKGSGHEEFISDLKAAVKKWEEKIREFNRVIEYYDRKDKEKAAAKANKNLH